MPDKPELCRASLKQKRAKLVVSPSSASSQNICYAIGVEEGTGVVSVSFF